MQNKFIRYLKNTTSHWCDVKSNWIINGIMYLKSLYFTLSAVINNPAPKAMTKASIIKNGKNKICQPGKYQ